MENQNYSSILARVNEILLQMEKLYKRHVASTILHIIEANHIEDLSNIYRIYE